MFLNGANPETAFLRMTCARKITTSEKEGVMLLLYEVLKLPLIDVELLSLDRSIVIVKRLKMSSSKST